ncbi:2-hydroxychromene-2-carboxylate isomerase [Novosphingobium sp. G106]|uniref:2-hydroxychromene-2-carboxylate isomerase n=1 Tax=Novosphingobium sp. G106 TaxID=2849500 RepID=UPI001C2D7B9A|nr:2-hydroxychromene-2-carboxylate isomerase [Novosphingobium sp. G106]MBV1687406.1 2-hydroxychromene-2-carboxylate isomerase [Novosphingobium sp. G106]
MEEADWYFDVVSPFAYLQWKSRARLDGRLRLRPVPIVLGALLTHWGQKGPAEIAPKRLHTYRACQWRATELGVPFRFPPAHPFNPIAALRLIVALDNREDAVDAVFDAAFRDGRDVAAIEVLEEIGRGLRVSDVAGLIGTAEVKQRLRENTETAQARGVFGVPTVALRGELFWGEDATGMLLGFLANPELFQSSEMKALEAIPVGAQRK